jgi:hypothetical protein
MYTLYVEMSQGNSLYSYLKQTKMSFFKIEIGEQEGRTGPVRGDLYLWEGGGVGERV